MMSTLFVLILGFLVHSSTPCPQVTVVKGVVSVNPPTFCRVELSGTKVFKEGPYGTLPGFWYGLVEYSCGDCRGVLPSKADECTGCLACYHDMSLIKCRPWVLLIGLGVFSGAITAILLELLFRKILKSSLMSGSWFNHLIGLIARRKVKKQNKKENKIHTAVIRAVDRQIKAIQPPPYIDQSNNTRPEYIEVVASRQKVKPVPTPRSKPEQLNTGV